MATSTSFQNRLKDIEARLLAEKEANRRDRAPPQMTLSSPSPRRPTMPMQFQREANPPERAPPPMSLNSPNPRRPSLPKPFERESDWRAPPPMTLSGPNPRRPTMPKPFERESNRRAPPPMTLSTPNPRRPTMPKPFNMEMNFNRPGPPNCLSTEAPLAPLRRKPFQLPCSPQSPQPQRMPDSTEIEMKYQEIMKQNGILNIGHMKVPSEITDLEPMGDLGQGTCGHVVKMRHRPTGQCMAVKQMRRSGNREENKRIIMDMDVVLKSHSCPFIVLCIGTFITPSDVWICMELMSTCLEKLLKRVRQPIPERILGKVAVATVKALHYLKEEHGVIHRDIKPSNILLNSRGQIKLCDFGISGRLVDSKAKTRSAGCAAYMAPERIDPPDPTKPDYDIRADVWSLGLSLVELATGEFPYKNCKTDFEVLTRVLEADPPVLPPRCGFSMNFCSFVSQCCTKDYRRRPKYKRLLEHAFITHFSRLNVDVAAWYAEVANVDQLTPITPTPTPSPVSPLTMV